MATRAATTALLMTALAFTAQAQDAIAPTKAELISHRLQHANQWRDHIMVVGHRGGVRENGVEVRAENSLDAIEAAISMDLEMVELDVQKTRDGVYVVLHDSWLDRTTTCKGRLLDRDYADLAACRLVAGQDRTSTTETVPTLREALAVAKSRILINIDNKLELADLTGMVAIARELGMEEQLVIKQNLWSTDKVREAGDLLDSLASRAHFMPIIADDAIEDAGFIETASRAVHANAVEMVHWRREAGPLTETGGPLFSPRARAVAVRNDMHLWVNTYAIVNKPAGYLSGGRGDQMATIAANPDDVFGFWVERGATIIQTDEPKAALEWLETNGYRRPYETPAIDVATSTSAIVH